MSAECHIGAVRYEKIMKNTGKNNNVFHFVAALIFVMALNSPIYASYTAFLPAELGNWRLMSEHVTELTASDHHGKWVSASYARAAPPARIEVQLTEGPGPGELFVPEGIFSTDDGPIGFSSTYETLRVAGKRAILERCSITGQALVVALGTRSITIEARGISREELLAFAESMIEALQDI